jgi:serine/threonine protein kinase
MADRQPIRYPVATAGAVFAGRYRLIEPIGRGGMADVFRGEDEVLHRPVAVKVFRLDTAAGNDRRRIDAEVRTLASLRHLGLVTVFDTGTVDEPVGELTPFLVMELITGPTLAQRLTESPLGAEQTAQLGADLAATLGHVHTHGVVHRDVKPANILLDAPPPGRAGFSAKLTDFGVALLANSTRLTMQGMTIGTANYLSPEQVEGASAGPASDVYALGLVLLECLTGQPAYPGVGIDAAVARLHRPPQIPTRYGAGWVQLLGAMTDRSPTARPTTEQVVAALSWLSTGPSSLSAGPSSLSAGPSHLSAPAAGSAQAGTAATAVLDAGGGGPGSTALLPAPLPGRTGAVRSRGVYLAATAALVVAVLLALLVGALSSHRGSGAPSPAPSYPSVPGPLGSHFKQLEATLP